MVYAVLKPNQDEELGTNLERVHHFLWPDFHKQIQDELKWELPLRYKATNQIVIVMAVPADGAMTLARIPYFLPSIARDLVRPMIPAFAVEYCDGLVRSPAGTRKTDVGLAKVAI